jgi:glycosyltransferase involved in cell wall biosynthesis
MKAIHQLMPCLAYGDAISNEALVVQEMLKQWGYESNIYAIDREEQMAGQCLPLVEHRKASSQANGVILHHSIGSTVSDYGKSLCDKKMLAYHNITPPHFFQTFPDSIRKNLDLGRKQLQRIRKAIHMSFCDSEYNADELRAFGYKKVRVLPIAIDFEKYREQAPCPFVLSLYDREWTNILYVGRIAPNKKVEDILRVFAFYQRINPRSRLILVGRVANVFDLYHSFLFDLADELGIKNLHLTGHVPFEKLAAFYQVADVFLLMSEHEGFGVPLLEAMFYGVPIVAFKSSAVPETLGKAGVLILEKKFDKIAEMLNLVLTDEVLRHRIVQVQKERLQDFSTEKIKERLRQIIEDFERC